MIDFLLLGYTAGMGLNFLSTYMQGQYDELEGEAEQMLNEFQASIAEANAKAALEKGRFDQRRMAEMGEIIMGKHKADIGGSGIRGDTGSAARLLDEQAKEIELEKYLIDYEARTEAANYANLANLYKYKGALAKWSGENAGDSSELGAFGGLLGDLGGFSKMLG